MKTNLTLSVVLLTTVLCCVAGGYGTSFTYQGRLNQAGVPANGVYQMTFFLCDTPSTGGHLANFSSVVPVSNGLFSVEINFGDLFNADGPRWLEIDVRTNLSTEITTLTPRQLITSTPYAIRAFNADATGLVGTIPSASLSGTYTSSVTFDNPANSYNGTFYGSFLGLSFIGGSFAGSFIGNGSGLANLNGAQITSGVIPAAALNNSWRTIGNAGTIPGTHFIGNMDNKPLEFRINNQRVLFIGTNANGAPNLVAGSPANSITGTNIEGATISGGGLGLYPNTVTANYATIGGGTFHMVAGEWSTVAGGRDNMIQADHSTIAGGRGNAIRPLASYSTIAGGVFNVINTNAYYSTVSGGFLNDVGTNSVLGVIGGGYENNIAVNSSGITIVGGYYNDVGTNSSYSVIGGGFDNNIAHNSESATIGGGVANNVARDASRSTIAGGEQNDIRRYSSYGVIGGGGLNVISTNSYFSTIAGGYDNGIDLNSQAATISGGYANNILAISAYSAIGGGSGNQIGSNVFYGTIPGGTQNTIDHDASYAVIGGGQRNTISGNGYFATIPGGVDNAATNYAFAAGRQAKANHQGAFVWGDSTPVNIFSLSPDSVTMRASGGYRLFSDSTATAGVSLAPGGTAWAVISDRNAKKDFAAVDSRAILEKLAALPITRWHYRWEEEGTTPHIGPVAQDFKAAFYPGRDDKSITTQEADGVALAAIQGLNQKLEQKLEQKETEITELRQRLAALEKIILNQR